MTTESGDPKAANLRLLELLQDSGVEAAESNDPFDLSLVRLQPYGDKRPFFCVHPGSGSAAAFLEVAPNVDPSRPFLAFQSPGMDGECEPVADFVTLARGYVRQVQKIQPRGPYLLGGFSAGGTIAFQMAHELRAAGEEIALLVLCETKSNEVYLKLPITRQAVATVAHRELSLLLESIARQRGKSFDPNVAFERFEAVRPRSLPDRLDLIFQILHEAGIYDTTDTPAFKVFRSNLTALTRYELPKKPLDVTITLLRCKNEGLGVDFTQVTPTYEWARHSTRPIEVIDMPGQHFTLFHGDVAPVTAQTLRRLLDAADT